MLAKVELHRDDVSPEFIGNITLERRKRLTSKVDLIPEALRPKQ
jgi:hypothetical protein